MTKFTYPKNYRKNLVWRRTLLRRAKAEPEFKQRVRELFFRDPVFAFNAFFYTYDPRKRPFHQQPFCTWDYQDETILKIISAINKGEDLALEKSRDMGASWMVILCFLWCWLNPTGGADFLLGSRIEDYVDKKGDMRTLLEKARYALYRVPTWLRPKGFRRNKHDNFMRLYNPETGATITGESNNANFSTGGRYAAILFDEFAKWESTDESAWTAAGDASPCRIPVSTPFGAGGQYYKIVTDGKTKKIVLHWTLHPEKSFGLACQWPPPNIKDKDKFEDWEPEVKLISTWYLKQCERRGASEIAQELDIDYLGAGTPVFEGEAMRSISYFIKQNKEPIARYLPCLITQTLQPAGSASRYDDGIVLVWAEPRLGEEYLFGVDVAEGLEHGDYSVVKIYSRNTKSVVATLHSRTIDENELGRVIWVLAKYYHGWIGIETNGPGLATFDKCLDLGLEDRLFMMPTYDSTKGGPSYRKGWRTTGPSKNMLIAGVKEWLVHREGWIDARCAGECGTYQRNSNGKAAAKAGCNDDEVIAFGICLQLDELTPRLTSTARQKKERATLEKLSKREGESWPIWKDDDSTMAHCLNTVAQKQALLAEGVMDAWELEVMDGY